MAERDTDGIGEEFMQLTRFARAAPSDQRQGKAAPPVVSSLAPEGSILDLPAPADLALPQLDLQKLMTERTSLRKYVATPLSLAEMSYLLWCTQGVKSVGQVHTMRTVPSAGARHPFETVVLANRVEGVEPGLYAYEAVDHQLATLRTGPEVAEQVAAAAFGQGFVKACAATFLWVAVPYRTTWRYGQRGYRYMHLDAGHVCQNLYLAAEAIGHGACAVAAFDDDAMIAFLGLDPAEAFVIYLAAVGKRGAAIS